MKTKFTLLTSLLIFTQVMQAHSTGHDHGFVETISHLFTQAGHSLWLAMAAVIVAAAYCLRLAFVTK
ncbi:MAG: hypothetical protein DBX01_00185 [Puniceicoccaceae bacterium]|nr:hypothetical protein [Puniceicoccaceae bacterium]RCL36964.1 MAG: hypothetical protein DBX01_00185 [Puniceicoccaceae bacterium]